MSKKAKQILVIILELLAIIIIAGGMMFMKEFNKIRITNPEEAVKPEQKEEVSASAVDGEQESEKTAEDRYTNIALIGLDVRNQSQLERANSDTMIIASINQRTGNVRMVSLYRDTLLNIDTTDGDENIAAIREYTQKTRAATIPRTDSVEGEYDEDELPEYTDVQELTDEGDWDEEAEEAEPEDDEEYSDTEPEEYAEPEEYTETEEYAEPEEYTETEEYTEPEEAESVEYTEPSNENNEGDFESTEAHSQTDGTEGVVVETDPQPEEISATIIPDKSNIPEEWQNISPVEIGYYNKANAAYANGGIGQFIRMVENNLDISIDGYVVVNFSAVADMVDDLGGIDVWMTKQEVIHMNNYCVETSEATGKEYEPIEPEEEAREYHLTGVQAVSYARIRYTAGNDMKRTQRQRVVINKIVNKSKENSFEAVSSIITKILPNCRTSFSAMELAAYASQLEYYNIEKTDGFPSVHIEKNCTVNGNRIDPVVPVTLKDNVKELHRFLFNDEDYHPSVLVSIFSNGISEISGLNEADREFALKNSVIEASGGEADVVK